MKKNNSNTTWKRVATGALSLALVAGTLPANVGGLLTGGGGIVASAVENAIDYTFPTAVGQLTYDGMEKELLTAGTIEADKGSFEYTVCKSATETPSDDAVWSADIPTATDAGTYYVWWKIVDTTDSNIVEPMAVTVTIAKGSLTKNGETDETVGDYTAPTAAKTLKPKENETDLDTYYDSLYYTGEAQSLVTEGSVAEGKGAMEYASGRIIQNNSYDCYTNEIRVGDILKPTGSSGFFFNINDANYTKVRELYIGDTVHCSIFLNKLSLFCSEDSNALCLCDGLKTYTLCNNGTYDAIRVTAVKGSETDGYIITTELVKAEDALDWSADVPEAKEAGTYDVQWRITGNDNYEPVTGGITNEIKAKTAVLGLSELDDAVITKANGTVLEVNNETDEIGKTVKYTVEGGTYYLYTNESVAGADETNSIASLVGNDVQVNGATYTYKYELTIPTLPSDDGYMLSRTKNWIGIVNNTKRSKLYVADGAPDTKDESQIAAVLQSTGKLYFGDEPTEANVDIKDGYGSIIKVKSVYLTNDKGTKLDLTSDNVAFGNYKLTAEIIIDNDGDGDFATGVSYQQICTLYADIEYVARPMNENKYYLVTENPAFDPDREESETNKKTIEKALEVVQDMNGDGTSIEGSYSVIVPEGTFTYDGTAKAPEIVVKNGGSETVLTADEYFGAATKQTTKAGEYSFTLTAVADSNYTDKVTVNWSIEKAQANITVTPKSNLTYDGAVLDFNDFEFTADENDTLAQSALAGINENTVIITPVTENAYSEATGISAKNVGKYLTYGADEYYYHTIKTDELESDACICLPGIDGAIPVKEATAIGSGISGEGGAEIQGSNTFAISKDGTLVYAYDNAAYNVTLEEGNGWYLQKTQYGNYLVYEVVQKELPIKTYDLKSAGLQKASITVNNPNIDVVVNFGELVTATIAKKTVTITPAADQGAVFGQIKTEDDVNSTADDKFFAPDYTIDGIVDADKETITTFGDILDVQYNKTATEETPADVTKYDTMNKVDSLSDALNQSSTVLSEGISYNIADLEKFVAGDAYITLPNGTDSTYGFFYSDKNTSVYANDVNSGTRFNGFNIDASGTLEFSTSLVTRSITLEEGKVWVVTGVKDTENEGKYISIKIEQITAENTVAENTFVNAGTYQFTLEKQNDGANYSFQLAETSPTYVIEQKSLKNADITLAVDKPTYTYDGTKKTAPTDYVITDEQVGNLVAGTDFEVGGQTVATLPKTYQLEYSGLGNYTDMITSDWTIESDATYQAEVSIEDKTYDGETVTPTVTYTVSNPNYIYTILDLTNLEDNAYIIEDNAYIIEDNAYIIEDNAYIIEDNAYIIEDNVNVIDEKSERIEATNLPKNIKTTYTYYEWANDEMPTEDELATLTALDGAPKDAGKYLVVAKTTARGYEILDCMDTFEIKQKEITVTPAITSMEFGKFDTFDGTKYSYDTAAIVAGDTVNVTGVLGCQEMITDVTYASKYGYNVGDYAYVIPNPEDLPDELKDQVIHVDNANYKLVTDATLTVTPYEITDDNIKVTGKCVAGANGWAYPDDCIKVVANLYNTETKQYEEVELEKDINFTVTSAIRTKQLGEFDVEIEGKGDYITDPIAVAEVEVISRDDFNALINVTSNTTVEDSANKKLRLTVNASVEDNVATIVKTGLIVYRGTTLPEAGLTIESAAANNDIYDFSSDGTSYSPIIKDSKGGVHYVGYTILADGTVKYGDVISTTVENEIANAITVKSETTVEDPANRKLRLTVNASVEDNVATIVKTGLIVYRGTTLPEVGLTIESAAANNDIYDFSSDGTSYSPIIKDSKGGVHYVGYTILADGTVKYGDVISTTIEKASAQAS